jgi:predicted N-formylglutamate amidohydrolase
MSYRILAPDEPPPFFDSGPKARSPFVITVDHASGRIPRRLGDLGLPPSHLRRHIAWDVGALEVARGVAAALDARLIATNYSRLVIDCNRDVRVASSILEASDSIEIPGNVGLSDEEVAARRAEFFHPYHDRLRALLDERARDGRRTILVTQHSMTDVFGGLRRDMHAAILYNRDRRFAGLLLEILRRESGLSVGDNEPYFVSDHTDYTIPVHGEARGLPHVEIEIRQDLLMGETGRTEWARRIAHGLRAAEQALGEAYP